MTSTTVAPRATGAERTARAREVKLANVARRKQEAAALLLREAGWSVYPPGAASSAVDTDEKA